MINWCIVAYEIQLSIVYGGGGSMRRPYQNGKDDIYIMFVINEYFNKNNERLYSIEITEKTFSNGLTVISL